MLSRAFHQFSSSPPWQSITTSHQRTLLLNDYFHCGMFEATNGVKQGEVLSPIIFAVYVDGLFHR